MQSPLSIALFIPGNKLSDAIQYSKCGDAPDNFNDRGLSLLPVEAEDDHQAYRSDAIFNIRHPFQSNIGLVEYLVVTSVRHSRTRLHIVKN